MYELSAFADLELRPEDLQATGPGVSLDGTAIPEGIPEQWEKILRHNPRVRRAWEDPGSYPSPSEAANAYAWYAGAYGLTKEQAAAVLVAFYAVPGRKPLHRSKLELTLRTWAKGRARLEALHLGAGNGEPPEPDPTDPGPADALPLDAGQPAAAKPSAMASPRFSRPLSELLAVPDEPIPFLIEPLLVASANGFVGGEPKSLKSWLVLYLALCLSLGVPVFGRYAVPAPVRVLYLQEEDGERRVRRRVRKILVGLGMDPPSDEFFRYSIKAGLLLDDERWLSRLRAELEEYRPAIVLGDVFELMHTRDGDRRAELKPVFYSLDRLREEFGCGFLLADHFKKASIGTSKRGGQRLSGTVGKHAWGENSLYLFPLPGKNHVRVETELKDAASETFGLTLEDTPDGGAAFRWEAEAEDREAEAKGKVLAALEGLALPGEWVKTARVADAAGMSENTARKYLDALVDVDGRAERERRAEGRAKPWYWRLRK